MTYAISPDKEKLGYNMRIVIKDKIAITTKGRIFPKKTIEQRKKLSQSLTGKIRTLEQRKRISDGSKGKRSELQLKTLEKMAKNNKGLHRSEETKEKIRQGHLKVSFEKKMKIVNLIIFSLINNRDK